MQATPSSALRLRLLEPSVGVVSGGTRVIIHGVGFRPPPHSLVVRFRVNLEDPDDHTEGIDASGRANLAPPQPSTVDVNGRFHLETQLECIVPNFELQAKRAIAARTSLAASSASVNSAPQLVPLSVEILLNGGELHSNILIFRLHQPLEVQRVSPQSVLMASPAVTMTSTLNILKLPGPTLSRTTIRVGQKPLEILEDMSVLPVYVRVKQVSERTGAVSEQTREGRWKLAPVGVYEVEFDAVTLGFGAATVELSLNRVEFFRCKVEAPPEAHGYRVHRDVSLSAVEPPCINVTSGHVTEVRLLGDGFVDTGDLVVALSQKELPVEQEKASGSVVKTGNVSPKEVQVAELNATFYVP
ncbi:hypothetical protein BBJ29_005335 [Phytophthora kernoviae]|uniref:IPT/TIG domain-containing protein n=1 Tax=Phytophthora kernoviae TaxID=325452 RepID=A0A3F2RHQ0_9STRA|nr:hypothetical protein BBP00_00007592 [Phytophthora kernoviae]RLN71190.1 hypothetical protein BBJ29_005335 [Phytophthora kernoviae]